MKCQKCSKSEARHKVGEVLHYTWDRAARSKRDWQGTIQFVQINVY